MSHPLAARIRALLEKAGIPVLSLEIGAGGLYVTIADKSGGEMATVAMELVDPSARYYRTVGPYGFYYRARSGENADLIKKVDLIVAVLSRLKLETLEKAQRPEQWFSRHFPFATVDMSLLPDGSTAAQVLVRVTGRCNQACPFCSGPDLERDPTDEELRQCLLAAARDFPGCLFTLTGGEPTLRKGWVDYVGAALATEGVGSVQVQTNAIVLANKKVALPAANKKLWFFVSLHAVQPELYDFITRSRGQLPRAIQGTRRLIAAGHGVILNAVAAAPNARHLPELIRSIPVLFEGLPTPEVHISVLMCPPHRPAAADWLVPYEDLLFWLRKATEVAHECNVPTSPMISSTHASIPPCFLQPEERDVMRSRPLVQPGETGYEDMSRPWVKRISCRFCQEDSRCLGVPAPYAQKFGLSGLKPIVVNAQARAVGVDEVLVLTKSVLGRLDEIAKDIIKESILQPRKRFVLEVLPPDATSARDEAVSFSMVFSAMPPALRALGPNVVRIRSRAGRPACLFWDEAQQVLLHKKQAQVRLRFAPQCEACVAREGCTGLSEEYIAMFGYDELRPFLGGQKITWKDKARWLLVGRPEASIAVTELVSPAILPDIPCTRPWLRLEYHDGGTFGPCCADYMLGRYFVPAHATTQDLWFSDLFEKYRLEMLYSEKPAGCRNSCPVLQGRLEPATGLRLRGGSEAAVENQVRVVESLIERKVHCDWSPLSLCVPVTSFCNYDCLMCECGEKGDLGDEKPLEFWQGLGDFIGQGAEIDANGGEPLASPVFRRWLRDIACGSTWPFVSVVTNAAFLTPRFIGSFKILPFRSLTVSLNAATPETYLAVNRGLSWSRIRRNLDALLDARLNGRLVGEIIYSMVILKTNIHEIIAFAEMAIADKVGVRFLLPQRNRNNQSIMTDERLMVEATEQLEQVAERLFEQGEERWARDALAGAKVIRERLSARLFEPLGNLD